MSNNNNFGPYWTVGSQEMGVGLMIVAAIMFAPVFPLAYLGWHIGADIIGNNFAKLGLGLLFFVVGYLMIIRLNDKGFKYAAMFVFAEYLAFDARMSQELGRDELYMVTFVKNIISWGLNNT